MEELADRAQVSLRAISYLEVGRTRRPYRRTVALLADALALDPAARTQLDRAARLSPQPPSAAPSGPGGAGPGDADRGASPDVRFSLPPDTGAFTGRDEELARIAGSMARAEQDGGVVAIHAIDGMPGIGKTALAVHAAHLLRDRFPARQVFVDLRGHRPAQEPLTAEEALAGLLAAAGVDPRHVPDDVAGRSALWRDKMAGQQALIILDDAVSSAQVAPLLPASSQCLVLVTSRAHLADLPGAVDAVLLDILPVRPAQEMFVRLAPRAASAVEEVAGLVALAGHLPLAISLLARLLNRHPTWSLADLAAETQAHLLTMAAESDSVAAAFEMSYRYLEPARREFFRTLAGTRAGSPTRTRPQRWPGSRWSGPPRTWTPCTARACSPRPDTAGTACMT